MADVLIETVDQNPYGDILTSTTDELSKVNHDISRITDAINNLERLLPNSPILSQLRERLNTLQTTRDQL